MRGDFTGDELTAISEVFFFAAAFHVGESHCHYPTWYLGPEKQVLIVGSLDESG